MSSTPEISSSSSPASTPRAAQIAHLHGLYRKLTGLVLRLDMHREHVWWQWAERGFTAADLADVILHLRREIRNGNRQPGALRFSNLIGSPDFFEEDLALVRAQSRKPPPPDPARAAVLRATGRDPAAGPQVGRGVPTAPPEAGKPIAELIRELRASVGLSDP